MLTLFMGALLIALAFIDLVLAALAAVIWFILSMLLNKDSIYSGKRALLKTRKAVYVAYSSSIDFKRNFLSLSRGLKILGGWVEPSQLTELAINVSRKSARYKGKRRMEGASLTVDSTLPKKRYFKIHFPATLRKSASRMEFPTISWESLMAKLLSGRARVSLVIVLDSSASMAYSIRGIMTALKAIEKEARRYRDRVALIVCKGSSATIVQHPTTNFNLMLGKIVRVGLDDFTPLAAGMYLGYNMALRERRKGYEPVLVVISDGNANVPLERKRGDSSYISLDPAVRSVLDVASLIARNKIETVVINTRHRVSAEDVEPLISGTKLLISVAKFTKGNYVGIMS
ncbi:MAG: VWA domain-containing protein [Thermofilaceae archaeon]